MLSRRSFIRASVAVGAATMLGLRLLAQSSKLLGMGFSIVQTGVC
ncbi:twin-arginine translocation signal domain-containing protein [Paraburkholderia agricolaris]